MALVDLKSNLANFRAEFKTPSVESQAIKKLNQPSAIKDEFPATDSNLDIDRIPGKFITIGKSRLSNNRFIKTSKFNIDLKPELYNKRTKFTKQFVDRSEFNREDNFILKYTGRTRFTTKYVNAFSKFNIDTTPSKFSPGMFIPTKFTDKKVINVSKYNLDESPDKYINVGLRRLSLPRFINRSIYNIDATPNKHGNDSAKTNFKGISGRSFKFPNILTAVFRTNAVELKNSKFGSRGFATVENQLGAGSLFHYTINGGKNNKIFSSRGYYDQLKYGDAVKGGRGSQESNSLLYRKATEQNSPSAIEQQYKKFNLRDEAFNYSYINHPLILRGIQRKGKEEPNRWGIDKLVNYDSGLVRGGITAAVERAANDTARLAKWVASPKGLLWVVKQVGLGLSNPKVEAIGGPLTRQTRIHTGVASLLSVPTTAFGLHFTRHGIPFANEVASYENVSKKKNDELTYNLPDPSGILVPGNRLIALKKEYGTGESVKNKIKEILIKTKIFKTKSFGSNILFSLGGAQSVYGIGFTAIRRTTDTFTDSVNNAKKQNYTQIYDSGYGYNPDLNNNYSVFKSLSVTLDNKNVDLNLVNKAGIKVNSFKKFTNYYDKLAHIANKPLRQSLDSKAKQEATLLYNLKQRTSAEHPNGDVDGQRLIEFNNPEKPGYYAGATRAKTGKDTDAPKSTNVNGLDINVIKVDDESSLSLKSIYKNTSDTRKNEIEITLPGSDVLKPNPFKREKLKEGGGTHALEEIENATANIKNYATLAYNKIPNRSKETISSFHDFRDKVNSNKSFIGKQDTDYYNNNNLESRYGFSKAGPDVNVKSRGEGSFIIKGQQFSGGEDAKGQPTKSTPWDLVNSDTYTGDKITGIDIIKSPTDPAKIYSNIKGGNTKDFIKFYFADGEMNDTTQVRRAMVFRATISGLSETFSPSWSSIQIMGRPDSAYRYDSFERSISFEMKVYAMTRSEMIPMWRKLNYLASFTAPDFVGGYAAGPFMRLTLGDLYYNCPGFLDSLSYTIPDESPWDIADDDDPDAKQLPMMVDVSVGYKIIGTHRPINMGRMYALGPNDSAADVPGQWLGSSKFYEPPPPDPGGLPPDAENTTENTGFTGNQGVGQGNNNTA